MTNHIYSRMTQGAPEPVVDMPATILLWTDRNAGTVVHVWTERKHQYVTIQEDRAIRTDKNGLSDSQEYDYKRDPFGRLVMFRREPDGRWREAYRDAVTKKMRIHKYGSGNGLILGRRETYRDPSF
jgi:hypothetical protein